MRRFKRVLTILLVGFMLLPFNGWAQGKEGSVIKTSVGNLEAVLSGGVSGGYFYTNNPGAGHSKNRESKFVLTNALFDLNLASKDYPVSLDVGLGGTATPSLLNNPEDSGPGFDIEYADFSITPVQNLTLEAGLLQPNAGYEDTYTFNNKNITVGVIASQQPYNAYGARATYSIPISSEGKVDIYAGYYRNRLDDTEYRIDNGKDGNEYKKYGDADNSYELGVSGNIFGFDTTFYFYNINRIKSLTGITFEKDFDRFYVAFDADYWQWNGDAKRWLKKNNDDYKKLNDDSAYGVSFYISPKITKQIEVPVRLEYINQRKSEMYVESADADDVYAVTVTPTVYPTENTYVRVEGGYVYANNGFEDNHGATKDSKYYLSTEVGFKF